jgi:hypothetical protein
MTTKNNTIYQYNKRAGRDHKSEDNLLPYNQDAQWKIDVGYQTCWHTTEHCIISKIIYVLSCKQDAQWEVAVG